ncbi:hypothetical protein HK101_001513 [Irineochytrium annulatum]|nr:hypothetical protein HK101_001513 [Irineochytrium annulatum]
MGYDELKPVSKEGISWLHLGLTAFDALDTAYLMGNRTIFDRAAKWVEEEFVMIGHADVDANVFETTIRVLGGLLAAHHMSGREGLKKKAIEVADRLMPAFETGSKLPLSSINLKTGKAVASASDVSTAEATTLQLEFKYLSHITGEPRYWNAVEGVMKLMDGLQKQDGLVPIYMSGSTGTFRSREIRLGSRGDSYYEYLAKQYLLTNRTQPGHLRMYREAISGVKQHLLMRSRPSHLLYIRELPAGVTGGHSDKMDHLVCFLPGTMALAATSGRRVRTREDRAKLTSEQRADLFIAEELARGCYEMYHQSPAGLAPEISFFKEAAEGRGMIEAMMARFEEAARNGDASAWDTIVGGLESKDSPDDKYTNDFEVHQLDGHNLLRPETVESLFVLHWLTGERKYREWGWRIYRAFERWCWVNSGGFTSLNDVLHLPPTARDRMESFFLGETLKYFYLLFSDEDLVPLDKYVFNTEAHPLPIFEVRADMKDKLIFLDDVKA